MGWETATGGKDNRLHLHMLHAGVFFAKITEWADRGTADCAVWLRSGEQVRLLVAHWTGQAADIEQHKARAEAEIRRLATEALAALGDAS